MLIQKTVKHREVTIFKKKIFINESYNNKKVVVNIIIVIHVFRSLWFDAWVTIIIARKSGFILFIFFCRNA